MIKTICGCISEELFEDYLDSLIGRFYKILPMFENEDITLGEYMKNLERELIGSKNLIISLQNDNQFLILISTLQYLIDNEYTHKTCKSNVMKCISISQKLKDKYFGKE